MLSLFVHIRFHVVYRYTSCSVEVYLRIRSVGLMVM